MFYSVWYNEHSTLIGSCQSQYFNSDIGCLAFSYFQSHRLANNFVVWFIKAAVLLALPFRFIKSCVTKNLLFQFSWSVFPLTVVKTTLYILKSSDFKV